MKDILDRLQARQSEYPDPVISDAISEIAQLRSMCGRTGAIVQCPPVPKSIDPTGW